MVKAASGQRDQEHVHANAILVTGGSGFIGRPLVKKLAQAGKTVVSMYHHRLPEPMANVYPVCSDLNSADLLGAPLRGVDTAVHLAWENNLVGSELEVEFDPSFRKASRNVRQLRNLLSAMEKAGTRRIIFISANGAHRHSPSNFLREKYLAEYAILNSRIPEKIIIRPGVICGGGGNHDRFLRSIVNVMKFPGIYPVPDFGRELSPLHIEDMTELLKSLLEIELRDSCALLEVVGSENFKIEEIFRLVSERFTKGAKVQIRGALGNTLTPFFEKSSKENPGTPKLRHYLCLGSQINASTRQDNPIAEALPKTFHSFREILAENQSM